MVLDTQQVELVGRNLLISRLIAEDVEVAVPLRDRGVDLIAFHDNDFDGQFYAVPIQLKSFSKEGFSVNGKYAKFADMLMTYVWYATNPAKAVLYVMPYVHAIDVAHRLGWLETPSWIKDQTYSTSSPSKRVKDALRPYLYQPGAFTEWVHDPRQ